MFRSALIALLLSSPALAQQTLAQQPPAPIERGQPPAQHPEPTGVSAWPTTGSIKPGTHLIVTTLTGLVAPYKCKLLAIEPDHILCTSNRTRTTTFDRAAVESILLPPHRQFLVSTILFASGGTVLLVDLIALRAGSSSSAIGNSALGALYALLGGSIVRSVEQFHGPGVPTPIYLAQIATLLTKAAINVAPGCA